MSVGHKVSFIRETVAVNPNRYTYHKPSSSSSSRISPSNKKTIDALRIPPAWTPAYICDTTRDNKILWTAMDKKGRTQKRYSPKWISEHREYNKLKRLETFTDSFWESFHRVLDNCMKQTPWNMDTLHALIVKTMYYAHFRIGTTKSVEEDDTSHYGTVSLLRKHISIEGKTNILFSFTGKSGKFNQSRIRDHNDPLYLRTMIALSALHENNPSSTPNDRFFVFSHYHPSAFSVRQFLQENNLFIKPKDFRTYHANLQMLSRLMEFTATTITMTQNQKRKFIAQSIRDIAQDLNNTPKISKSSYLIAPIWMLFLEHHETFQKIIDRKKSVNENLVTLIQYLSSSSSSIFHGRKNG